MHTVRLLLYKTAHPGRDPLQGGTPSPKEGDAAGEKTVSKRGVP